MARTHVPLGDNPLCGNSSVVAAVNRADCQLCVRRLDELLLLVLDAADGQDVRERAERLVDRFGITRES